MNGYVIKERDSQDLIQKIEMFLSKNIDEKKQMGLEARKKVEREFDRKIVLKAYMMEIKSIL